MFIGGTLMFATPLAILNFNSRSDETMIDPHFQFSFANYFLNQYLLSLGEFATDAFDSNPHSWLCWLLFILATLITCITLLNMLIAIMGDTFERVMENKDTFAISNKMTIMGEYSDQI